ncbi:ATP-binding cassette domain-containing protein [Gordonia polyisoprenivorans]|nr:ATP-binding cassette domain-containing protein [Gordonia polyisoprenivorans]
MRRGIVLVAEGHEIVGFLSVAENIELGAYRFWPRSSRAVIHDNRDRIYDLFPILADKRNQLASLLSGGQQQMVAIGRALMSQPRLILLDEPSFGLAPVVVEQIYERLALLRRETQLSMVIVEQNSDLALEFCDTTSVMRLGEFVARSAGGATDRRRAQSSIFRCLTVRQGRETAPAEPSGVRTEHSGGELAVPTPDCARVDNPRFFLDDAKHPPFVGERLGLDVVLNHARRERQRDDGPDVLSHRVQVVASAIATEALAELAKISRANRQADQLVHGSQGAGARAMGMSHHVGLDRIDPHAGFVDVDRQLHVVDGCETARPEGVVLQGRHRSDRLRVLPVEPGPDVSVVEGIGGSRYCRAGSSGIW